MRFTSSLLLALSLVATSASALTIHETETGGDILLLSAEHQRLDSALSGTYQHDDGTFETFWAGTSNGVTEAATRFDFSTNETVTAVEVCWLSGAGANSFSYEINVYQDPGGFPGATLTSVPVRVDLPANQPKCVTTALQLGGLDTEGRNIWVGAKWTNNGSVNVGLRMDTSGFSSTPATLMSTTGWVDIIDGFPSYRHLGIRLMLSDGTGSTGSQTPNSHLILPYFEVNNGVVALYAVRNVTGSDIFLVTDITLSDGTFLPGNPTVLKAGATTTVNLGDRFAPGTGIKRGQAGFFVTDASGSSLSTKALTGDFFLVDPGNNFAVGDPLPSTICNRSTTRFADGGIFNGTAFTFSVTNFDARVAPGTNGTLAPFVNAKVFDESGALFANVNILTSSGILKLTTAELKAIGVTIPQFGSIEWTFLNNLKGLITWSMNAESRFSIGMTATCID